VSDYYENPDVLSEYLLFHYGLPELRMPWSFGPKVEQSFPEKIAHLFQRYYPINKAIPTRALDLGCAVGRTSFELSRWFNEVFGIDYSHAFIKQAKTLASEGKLEFDYRIHGDQFESTTVSLPEGSHPQKIHFLQGDAMQIKEMNIGKFDLIIASNLICRLTDPGAFLASIPYLLNPDGIFVLSTPFSYSETFTEKSKWLGGRIAGFTPLDAVNEAVSNWGERLDSADIPMVIREHERKFQWTVCHVTAWKQCEH